jgi:hypothetical protein
LPGQEDHAATEEPTQPKYTRGIQASKTVSGSPEMIIKFLTVGARLGYPRIQLKPWSFLGEGEDGWNIYTRTHDDATLARAIDKANEQEQKEEVA